MVKRPHERGLDKRSTLTSHFPDAGALAMQIPAMDRRRFLYRMFKVGGIATIAANLPIAENSTGQEPANGLEDRTESYFSNQSAGTEGEESAELASGEDASLLKYIDPKTSRYRCGLMLDTGTGNCRGVVATFPILREWPEQKFTILSKDIDPIFRRWAERELGDGLVSQFVTQVPAIRAGMLVNALYTYEVTRTRIIGPSPEDSDKVDKLEAPQRPGNELRQFLGTSPYIDPSSARIRMAVREIEALGGGTTWGKVEQIYDWVREKINYVEGEIKSADEALKDGAGDCEELTSAFIAICRAMRIPARMVYVLRHCYPEFYLEDAEGKGTWFPCQAAGTRQFGSMEEYRPILQKGDRFRVPEQGLERYVPELFKAKAVFGGDPRPRFVQEELD